MTVSIDSNNYEQANDELATIESLCICLGDGAPFEGLDPEHASRMFDLIREKVANTKGLLAS